MGPEITWTTKPMVGKALWIAVYSEDDVEKCSGCAFSLPEALRLLADDMEQYVAIGHSQSLPIPSLKMDADAGMPDIREFFGVNRWLSNFHKGKCVFDGFYFPCRENAFQYAKGVYGGEDKNHSKLVRFHIETDEGEIYTAKEAKQVGKKVLISPHWEALKVPVMNLVVTSAMVENPNLKEKLLATDNSYLEEGNYWHDTFWGVCYGELLGKKCKLAPHPPEGKNWLGRILMGARTNLSDKILIPQWFCGADWGVNMEFIDLSERINPHTQVLSGSAEGVNLRYEFDLEKVDKRKEPVTILFPHTVRAIGATFFVGMFGHSILKMGKDKFRKKYLFDNEDAPHLKSSIEAGINEAWSLLTKPEPDLSEEI